MSPTRTLTPQQQKALALIAAGATARAAAAETGVHRNTVANWLCLSEFRRALAIAQFENALALRDQTAAIVADAFLTIRDILSDPIAPASVRLKAALTILDRAAVCPVPPEENAAEMHNNAQPSTAIQQLEDQPPPPPEVIPPEREAASQAAGNFPAATSPKIGRNELCPCGSNIKFKRCCLGKQTDIPYAAAA